MAAGAVIDLCDNEAVLKLEPSHWARVLALCDSYRPPHGGCLQYPWTLFCGLRIAGFGVGGSPATAVSGRAAAPLKAAVRLVGMPEPSREERSVRARSVATNVSR